MTPPMCDMKYTGMEGAMYMDGSSEVEHQLKVIAADQSAETSWGDDNAVFEPYIASYQSGPAQSQRVCPFLQVNIFKVSVF